LQTAADADASFPQLKGTTMKLVRLTMVVIATFAWACGGGSSSPTPTAPTPTATAPAPTPTPTPTPTPAPAPTTSQATSIATGIGGFTAQALVTGGGQFGIAAVGPGTIRRAAASGATFSSANCTGGGKVDLIYVREYTPTSAGVDLSALKATFTSCATAADAPTVSGDLTMSGTYSSSKQTGTASLSGSLTTSAGACTVTGTVTASGSFSGTACGNTIAATTPTTPIAAPVPTPTPTPTPTASSLTGTWRGTLTTFDPQGSTPCGRDENTFQMTITQSGNDVSGSVTWTITQSFSPPDVGKSFTQPVTGTVSGSTVTMTIGTAARNFSGSGSVSGTTLSGTFSQPPCQPMPFSVTKQ
jgi:hypothetical protein